MVCLLEPEDDPLVQILMERVSYLAGHCSLDHT